MCDASVEQEEAKDKIIQFLKLFVGLLYLLVCLFLIPFCDNFFSTFALSSIYYAAEYAVINSHTLQFKVFYGRTLLTVAFFCMIMLLQTYFIRHVLIKFFVLQTEAEMTSETLTQILDNLPDAVMMFET